MQPGESEEGARSVRASRPPTPPRAPLALLALETRERGHALPLARQGAARRLPGTSAVLRLCGSVQRQELAEEAETLAAEELARSLATFSGEGATAELICAALVSLLARRPRGDRVAVSASCGSGLAAALRAPSCCAAVALLCCLTQHQAAARELVGSGCAGAAAQLLARDQVALDAVPRPFVRLAICSPAAVDAEAVAALASGVLRHCRAPGAEELFRAVADLCHFLCDSEDPERQRASARLASSALPSFLLAVVNASPPPLLVEPALRALARLSCDPAGREFLRATGGAAAATRELGRHVRSSECAISCCMILSASAGPADAEAAVEPVLAALRAHARDPDAVCRAAWALNQLAGLAPAAARSASAQSLRQRRSPGGRPRRRCGHVCRTTRCLGGAAERSWAASVRRLPGAPPELEVRSRPHRPRRARMEARQRAAFSCWDHSER